MTGSASQLVIASSTGNVTVPLTGAGVQGAPHLSIAPTDIDFGTVSVGSTVTRTFDIANTGNLLLTLNKAAPPAAPFIVANPVSEGQQLSPGDTIRQSVTFTPTAAGAFSGVYLITGNDGAGAKEVTLHGVATALIGPVLGPAAKCLDVRGAGTADGTPVQIYQCNGTNAQQWGYGADTTLRAQGKCLDIAGGGTVNGSRVQLWTCNGTPAQAWTLRGDGSLQNPQSGRCLDLGDTGWTGPCRSATATVPRPALAAGPAPKWPGRSAVSSGTANPCIGSRSLLQDAVAGPLRTPTGRGRARAATVPEVAEDQPRPG